MIAIGARIWTIGLGLILWSAVDSTALQAALILAVLAPLVAAALA